MWDCKYRTVEDSCRKRKKVCHPGDKGCALGEGYEFPLLKELEKKKNKDK